MYLRQRLTFQVLGILFEGSESTAHNTFNYWQFEDQRMFLISRYNRKRLAGECDY